MFKRRGKKPRGWIVTVDDDGVRRSADGGHEESVRWDELVEVRIVTTAGGPIEEDLFWLLVGSDGTGVAVPGSLATDDLLDRLQALPGFDNEQMILAMGSIDEAQFVCWQRDGE